MEHPWNIREFVSIRERANKEQAEFRAAYGIVGESLKQLGQTTLVRNYRKAINEIKNTRFNLSIFYHGDSTENERNENMRKIDRVLKMSAENMLITRYRW